VLLPAITSIATSLGARQVCDAAFEWSRRHPVHPVVVSDAQAVAACLAFADAQRVIVEPACGAALAAVQQAAHPLLQHAHEVLVVVCGGVAADHGQLRAWSASLSGGSGTG
jgi:L-serine/L-threonine ammonia-lyase